MHSVAVPILNHAGRAVRAISVAGTTPRSDGERLEALVARLRSGGDYLSRRLGFNSTNGVSAAASNGRQRAPAPSDTHESRVYRR